MRILVDIRHLCQPNQSGVGVYTKQILRALFDIDRENEYILFSSGRIKPNPEIVTQNLNLRNVHFVHVPTPNKILNIRSLLLGHPTINWHVKDSIDLIFLPNLNITLLPNNVPVVLTIHDLSWKIFPECYSKKMQLWHKATKPEYLIKKSNIIVPSESTKKDVEHFFSKSTSKITTIPHGINPLYKPHQLAQDHGVRSKLKLPKRFALFLGTLEPRKNVIAIIEAMKDYRQSSGDDLHLVLAGKWGWKNRKLKKQLWQRDVRDWVHLLGYIDQDDKPALYRSCEFFIWPSLYEGFGLPVLEAMACGTPVISSATSSIPEISKSSAILVDPFNTRDISEAIKGLINSPNLKQKLSKRGLDQVQNFSWNKAARETLEVFRKNNVIPSER